ncbi:MAG: AraC family transcriptional regulator [Paenibacillaceae bacterium]|jgi:AraC-like DNA-binding protein|nr:AraC family transcriptional regulator [Paenibacillaceae bacterium]
MSNNIQQLQEELAEIVTRNADFEGTQTTKVPSLSISCHTKPHYSNGIIEPYKISKPSIYIVVQGIKDVTVGEDHFRYGSPYYMVASMNLPIIAEVHEASNLEPNLSIKLEFAHSNILELLSSDELMMKIKKKSQRSLNVAKLDGSMLDAVVRLVRLLDKPNDIPILSQLYTKEILYKVLHGEHGEALRQIVTDGSPAVYIQKAIQYIVEHYQEAFNVERIAEVAKMSVPSLHRHFKEITAMSPIQFQKQLRLQEARRLLIDEPLDVAETASLVGYESTTQFIREYSRMFGFSPRKDVKRIRGLDQIEET